SFEAALACAKDCAKARCTDEMMVIGGADIFAASLPLAGRIYKTEVHGRPAGDTLMPEVDWKAWREVSREALPRGPHDDYGATLVRLERAGRPGS
ncbi:MAG: dihydrofolate reductase, partial [Hyphomicrobium sp.]